MSCTRPLLLAVAIAAVWFSMLILMVTPSQAASVQLNWSPSTKNADGGSLTDLAGYKVYSGLASRNYGTPIDVGNKTTSTLTGLTGGQRYYFAVTAYDTLRNESAFSIEVSTVPPLDPSLVANFTATPTSGTAPLAVTFTDSSSGPITITSWSWKFGDGGGSTQRNVTYTYQNPGTYDVTLTISGGGLSNTVTKNDLITVSQPPVPSSGLVAAYSFNEGTGTTVNDTSGKGNHGTLSGAQWTNCGRYGKALVFDGVNDWVTVNDASSLDLTTGMTLEAWVYPTALSGGANNGWRAVLLKQTTDGRSYTYSLYANEDSNRPSSYVVIGDYRGVVGTQQLPLNQWSHLAATYDGATQRLYVNGLQVASRSQTGQMQASGGVLRIGGNNIWNEFFQGRIDEVRIYNRALTASEIQTDMNKAIEATVSGVLSVQNPQMSPQLSNMLSALGNSTSPLGSASQQTANGSSTSSTSTTVTTPAGLLTSDHVEIGELEVDDQWKRVDLSKPFSDPIVVAKALSDRDAAPVVVGIRQTDATGFELRLQPWGERSRSPASEMVGYLVIERGRFRLPDGSSLESGTVDADPAYPEHSIAFSQPFRIAPVVMTAVPTVQDSMVATGRPALVSQKGFQFRLQPQGFSPSLDAMQTVSYVAWEPSKGTLGNLVFEVNKTRIVTPGQSQTIPATETFTHAPVFLADLQSSIGGNPINVRWEQKDPQGTDVKIDDISDFETDGGTPEDTDVVGYLLIR